LRTGWVGAWLGCRRRGIRLAPFADALAPGIAVAQAIGRWGNWFNQELFGRPTTLPWGLKIDPDRPGAVPGATAYHPTFLYESLWDLAVAGLVVWADRRFRLGRGRAFALYVMAYTVGRFWIEALRVDPAHHILGLRLNGWTSVLVFAGALVFFVLRRGPRETEVEPADREPAEVGAVPADTSGAVGVEPVGKATEGSVRPDGARSDDTAAEQPATSGVSGQERPAADVPSDRERP
jgi:prolipoprotein diacylglyceryltransferase